MLIEFTVENVLSYKDSTTLSMLASADGAHPESIFSVSTLPKKSNRLSKVSVLYGANASGKSNLFKAFRFLEQLVLTSHQNQLGEKIDIARFKLDQRIAEQPASFEVVFLYDDIQYQYRVKLDEDRIDEESLYHWPKGKRVMVFERTDTNNFKFSSGASTEKEKLKEEVYLESTLENTLFLSQATKLKHEVIMNAFGWFRHQYRFLPANFTSFGPVFTEKKCLKSPEFKEVIKGYLASADFSISDLDISEEQVDVPPAVLAMLEERTQRKQNPPPVFTKTTTTAWHIGVNPSGSPTRIPLDMDEESDGTQQFYTLIGFIHEVLSNGYPLFADELDLHLHPLLSRKIIELFTSKETNPRNAQLIFTTHNPDLLDLELFRRDQIWFVDRNRETCSSELFSLEEFSIRKDLNIRNAYLHGRFGAIPLIADSLTPDVQDVTE